MKQYVTAHLLRSLIQRRIYVPELVTKQAIRAAKNNPPLGDTVIPEMVKSYLENLEEKPERGTMIFISIMSTPSILGRRLERSRRRFKGWPLWESQWYVWENCRIIWRKKKYGEI